MTAGDQIVEAARSLLHTPFHWHGRVPGVGIDCVGVVVLAARGAGIEIEEPGRYSKGNQSELLLESIGQIADEVPHYSLGDVLILAYGKNRLHLGICAGETFVHASSSPTIYKVTEEPIDPKRIVSVWRFR